MVVTGSPSRPRRWVPRFEVRTVGETGSLLPGAPDHAAHGRSKVTLPAATVRRVPASPGQPVVGRPTCAGHLSRLATLRQQWHG